MHPMNLPNLNIDLSCLTHAYMENYDEIVPSEFLKIPNFYLQQYSENRFFKIIAWILMNDTDAIKITSVPVGSVRYCVQESRYQKLWM